MKFLRSIVGKTKRNRLNKDEVLSGIIIDKFLQDLETSGLWSFYSVMQMKEDLPKVEIKLKPERLLRAVTCLVKAYSIFILSSVSL